MSILKGTVSMYPTGGVVTFTPQTTTLLLTTRGDEMLKVMLAIVFTIIMFAYTLNRALDSAEQAAFIEIHGVETNDCWCPDDCPNYD